MYLLKGENPKWIATTLSPVAGKVKKKFRWLLVGKETFLIPFKNWLRFWLRL